MEGDLGLTLERWYDKARLHKAFAFETARPLDECVHQLRLMQPVHDDWTWGTPRAHREVIISQFDDHSADYTISQRRRGGRRSRGYRTTAMVQGRLERDMETGRTRVTGEATINPMDLIILVLVVPIMALFFLAVGFPSWFLLIMLAVLAYGVYSTYQDHANLVQSVDEALR